jgi:molecular chaperone GrpE (heat shock protein)
MVALAFLLHSSHGRAIKELEELAEENDLIKKYYNKVSNEIENLKKEHPEYFL